MRKDVEQLKRAINDMQRAIGVYSHELETIQESCQHSVVRKKWKGNPTDEGHCEHCDLDTGWYCPDSPNHVCDYPEGDEYCRYCGEPSERK